MQHMLMFEFYQTFVFDDQYFAIGSLAMSEKHCRLVSIAPSVQKRASSKKDRYRLGKWWFAIVGRFGFAQERNSFFCRRRTTAPAAKHPGPPCRAARSQCANRVLGRLLPSPERIRTKANNPSPKTGRAPDRERVGRYEEE